MFGAKSGPIDYLSKIPFDGVKNRLRDVIVEDRTRILACASEPITNVRTGWVWLYRYTDARRTVIFDETKPEGGGTPLISVGVFSGLGDSPEATKEAAKFVAEHFAACVNAVTGV